MVHTRPDEGAFKLLQNLAPSHSKTSFYFSSVPHEKLKIIEQAVFQLDICARF